MRPTFLKKLLFLTFSIAAAGSVRAELRLPQILGDHMVLQQAAQATLWGWADPGTRITVTASWDDAPAVCTADGSGRWRTSLRTPQADNTPHRITISDGQATLTLDDVLVGEVWFCSGQSNMEMPLDGFWNQPVEGANADIARAGRLTGVRMATIPHVKASAPQQEVGGHWEVCTSRTAPRFSATAFYFARMLNEVLGIPVGIIHCSWGGSKIEGWMPRELLENCPDIDLADTTAAGCTEYLRPTVMYNGMLHPLHNYTIRGFLWYQGCSNVGFHATYAQRQAAMVDHWRKLWGSGPLPFYFVEIAPYDYGSDDSGAYLREAQRRAATLIPHSGLVSTADLVKPYEKACIHPSRKREVGERLAFLALNRTYGHSGICCESPSLREMHPAGDGSVILSFDHAESGFASEGPLEGFEAAGADRTFRPATAELLPEERRIRISLPDSTPVTAVRYCFRDWAPARIWNCRGLPLLPFRTDDYRE